MKLVYKFKLSCSTFQALTNSLFEKQTWIDRQARAGQSSQSQFVLMSWVHTL